MHRLWSHSTGRGQIPHPQSFSAWLQPTEDELRLDGNPREAPPSWLTIRGMPVATMVASIATMKVASMIETKTKEAVRAGGSVVNAPCTLPAARWDSWNGGLLIFPALFVLTMFICF
jgi:hypothetical protein